MRRLPVIQNESPEDGEADRRSPATWVASGAVLTLLLWVAFATIAVPLGARLVASGAGSGSADFEVVARASLPLLAAFGLASLVSGAVLGRFAGRAVMAHAVLAGILAGGAGCVATLLGGAPAGVVLTLSFMVLAAVGAVGSTAGFRLGRRRRTKSRT